MRRIHIAPGVTDIAATVTDHTRRHRATLAVVVPGEYALWRTAAINLSVRRVDAGTAGRLRHLGREDGACEAFTVVTDVNGIAWERFSAPQQAEEIRAAWPDSDYNP